MTGLLTAFLAEIVLISYRNLAGGGTQVPATAPIPLPLPSQYTAPIAVYGVLALVPAGGQQIAGLVGWGLVVATALNLWNPGGTVKAQVSASPSTKPLNPSQPNPPLGLA